MTRWPDRNQIIDDLLKAAREHARNQTTLTHPEDIATALIVAIEIGWRWIDEEQP